MKKSERSPKNPEEATKKLDQIIKNTYKVLMTRGIKGCNIYCTDPELQEYIKNASQKMREQEP